jgi:hypothetical protein
LLVNPDTVGNLALARRAKPSFRTGVTPIEAGTGCAWRKKNNVNIVNQAHARAQLAFCRSGMAGSANCDLFGT